METTVFIQDLLELDISVPSPYENNEKQRALAKKRRPYKSELASLLSMDKLKQGDNEEWTFLLEQVQPKLRWYTYKITYKERFCDDIVAATVAHVYENRHLFHSADYLLGYMYNFARYECFNCMKKGGGAIIVVAEGGETMDWYIETYMNRFEGLTVQERIKWDEWQDLMIDQITTCAKRLPRNWVKMIKAYLVCQNVTQLREELGKNYLHHTASAFEQLKRLIRHQDFIKAAKKEQLAELKLCVSKLSILSKKIIRRILLGKPQEEIAKEFWPDSNHAWDLYLSVLGRAGRDLREVWPDPALFNDQPYHVFFSRTKGEEVDKIFKELLVDVDESSFTHPTTARIIEGSKDRKLARPKNVWSTETIQMMYELRTKGASWNELEVAFESSTKVIRRLVKEYLGVDLDTRVGRKLTTREERVTPNEAIAIRKEYAENPELSITTMSEKRALPPSTIIDIVKGRRWKQVEGCGTDLTEIRRLGSKKHRIIELAASGMLNKQIAKEVGCSEGMVSIALKGNTLVKSKHKEWEKQALQMLRAGATMSQIRIKLGGRSETVRELVDREFPQYHTMIRRSPRRAFDEVTEMKIQQERKDGKTITELAQVYNVNKDTIRRVLEEAS